MGISSMVSLVLWRSKLTRFIVLGIRLCSMVTVVKHSCRWLLGPYVECTAIVQRFEPSERAWYKAAVR